ncbi:MAG: hypothetical protein M3163_11930 [Actinomycetota bacterium]|nr:hypothetical protein [Actinomycetota bacterium]
MALVTVTLVDAIGTLVAARGLRARWRPTRQFYWATWRVWRAVARRPKGRPQESFLSVYAPITLLLLLGMWLTRLLVGWSLVYLAGESRLEGATGYGSLLYYSGTCLLTLGFGTSWPSRQPFGWPPSPRRERAWRPWPWPSPTCRRCTPPTASGSRGC